MATIRELRFSQIWMEPFPLDAVGSWRFGDNVKYEKNFNKIKDDAREWTFPWQENERQNFWTNYLGMNELYDLEAHKAWKFLVPFRAKPVVRIDTKTTPGLRATIEGFCYPYGMASVITVKIKTDLPFVDMINKAIACFSMSYHVNWAKSKKKEQLTLRELAQKHLDLLYQLSCDKYAQKRKSPAAPITVATIINAKDLEPLAAIEPNSIIHRGLEGLCTWDQNWEMNKLHDLEPNSYKLKDISPQSYLLYGIKRSRAVWFPGHFDEAIKKRNVKKIRKLGSYHRNQVLVSLQTESLLAMVLVVSGFLQSNQPIPFSLQNLPQNAVNALGRLYGGSQKVTYRTWSSRHQIEHYKDAVNRVRLHFEGTELHA